MTSNLTASAQLTASVQPRGAPQDRSTQFVPVEGIGPQTTDAGTFMVIAYVLMWLATVLFIVLTWRKTRGLQQRIDELQKAVSKVPQTGD